MIETPGHAAHHLSYNYKNRLFAGEAAGNYFIINDTEYVRPATPPRFFLDVFLNSIDRMLSLDDQPLYYAHCGSTMGSHRMLTDFRTQVLHWKEIIQGQVLKGEKDLINRCVGALLAQDPNLKAFFEMQPELQKREKTFLRNAVDGFIGYLKEENQIL